MQEQVSVQRKPRSRFGTFITCMVPRETSAPVEMASMSFRTVAAILLRENFVCVVITLAKKTKISAPAIRTNIQLNCIDNWAFFMLRRPFRYFSSVAFSFKAELCFSFRCFYTEETFCVKIYVTHVNRYLCARD